uniref:Amino acid transporter transmembrane domain-containing protein n=1 Tax=Brassica campestris TaxID=3711 RepID=M4CSB1_BRACM
MGISNDSSFGQAVLNGVNVLCGVGILSTPYAVKEGGWLGLLILFAFGVLCFYTGLLLRYCLDSHPDLQTYPDIGHAAFGTTGRILVSVILYLELYAMSVEYIILESDNLSSLFPNAALSIGGFHLDAPHLFALLTTIAVLPTVWLRDLSILSYISAGGVIASVLVVLCLFWVGLIDEVGIHSKGTPLNLATLPVSVGLYGYCYSGHGVFPNIYTSMAKPSQFPAVLVTCFGICTLMYAGVAVMGYSMFGESTESQFTLNLPQDLVASKIALWTTVKITYALTLSPVAMSLEELLPSNHGKSRFYAIAIRSALAFSTLLVGLAIPFFGLVMSLIGSFLTMLITLILPPACFLSILRTKVTPTQVALCIVIITVGAVCSAMGTYSALSKIIEKLST